VVQRSSLIESFGVAWVVGNGVLAEQRLGSFVDTFRLWSEGVYDAEEPTSLPAGAAA